MNTQWFPISEPPDDDKTVLLFDPKAKSEPIWPGWKDGEDWFWSDGSSAQPTHWCDFPEPPEAA